MNQTNTFSLDTLYKSYHDPKFLQDIESLYAMKDAFVNTCTRIPLLDEKDALLEAVSILETHHELTYRTNIFVTLRQSISTTDAETLHYMKQIQTAISACSPLLVTIKEFIAHCKNLDRYIEEEEKLKEYAFILHEIKQKQTYALSKDAEEVLSSVYPTSIKAFSDMYYHLTASASVPCLGKEMTLTQVKNLCHSTDKKIRKEAFLCEMKAYQQLKEPLAFAINNIKRQQLIEAKLRGYTSPLDKMLKDSRMSEATLQAMYAAVDKYLPVFHTYLKTKASLLGYENGLPWFDIYATLGKSDMTFSIKDCETYIVKHFKHFSYDLYAMSKRAIDEHWIDYSSHSGKQSGAYCENLPWIKESRILTNYANTLSDVVTVAHELGHAYHGMMIEDLRPLNHEYCMPLAETASTFNENLIYNALIEDADKKNKVFLMDTQLSALCQNICDIYTRFTFENSVFEKCESTFLFAMDLEELMLEAEKHCFQNGLDHNWLHPYRWITKVHYYIPDIAYYNFPYTFGALFSRGLYAMYQKEGTAFLPKYRTLLKATTTNTVEDCAKLAGIDVTKSEFWEESLASIAQQMQTFLNLVKEA